VKALEITLKSGATVTADANSVEWLNCNGGTALRWTTPDRWKRKLIHVNLDEIVAIVAVQS
jgi:hypothetical protein